MRQAIVYLKKMDKRQPIVSQPQRFADFAAEPFVCSLIVFLTLPKTIAYCCRFPNSQYGG